MENCVQILARELQKSEAHVQNVVALIDEGYTIPFIARYRKEVHGAMDDTVLRELEDRLKYLRSLAERREEVKKAIAAQEKLTPELDKAIDEAKTLAEVEDLYRPYKQKRRTRATIAKEKGLEPLAEQLFSQDKRLPDLESLAASYVDAQKGVATAEEALAGAADIVAEWVSDSAEVRRKLRESVQKGGRVASQAAKEEDSVYSLYYKFEQPLSRLAGHQILAINRGEKEGFLKVDLEEDREAALGIVRREVVKPGSSASEFVRAAAEDAYDRLILPSMERELRGALTDAACEGAIHNFAINLKPLLMQPPVKGHVTMGLDPGYRNGCKVAVVSATGKVLDTAVVYPTFGERQKNEAIAALGALIQKHGVEHIAIGNGTASRETEQMTCELISQHPGVSYMIVSEAGASVYSASKLAAEEFPQYDVNLRSAVSIARRLQDPLAELVKIDPKAIGVGQYQHDMPQKRLSETLEAVVEDCVNAVGVDVNTASPSLLKQVAGLNETLAKNIVVYREENGAFTSRRQFLKVPKMGPKAFEQCAGFLRVPESKNMLDRTGVHPEELRRGGETAGALRLYDCRRGGGEDCRPCRARKEVRRVEGGGGVRRRPADAPGRRKRADQTRPRPARRAAKARFAHGCAGYIRHRARHDSDRHGAQRHRLWRVCGHWRASGRACAHLRDCEPLCQAPVRGGVHWRRGQGACARRRSGKKTHLALDQAGF